MIFESGGYELFEDGRSEGILVVCRVSCQSISRMIRPMMGLEIEDYFKIKFIHFDAANLCF